MQQMSDVADPEVPTGIKEADEHLRIRTAFHELEIADQNNLRHRFFPRNPKMRNSVFSIVLAVALFSERYTPSTAVSTMTEETDSDTEQDTLDSLLNDEAAENSLGSGRSGSSKIVVLADPGMLRNLNRGHPFYTLRAGAAGSDRALTVGRRNIGQDQSPYISIARRGTMRCMVGRVYRPCWGA
ncbi:hypothetical protein DPEC_G00323420 [Dallia pectoralis]|uniref:Uncharacterized protein n=1 Tax=Dallia pectoralis TaxID=75939 RepID=A0ACC2FAZ6_DALPE|nr:hypothetical protein DPEC_G00323420 [Dallia pectoralis]